MLRVQAYDADMGVNGEVKYGIMHRDGISSGFDIDPETGAFHSSHLQCQVILSLDKIIYRLSSIALCVCQV